MRWARKPALALAIVVVALQTRILSTSQDNCEAREARERKTSGEGEQWNSGQPALATRCSRQSEMKPLGAEENRTLVVAQYVQEILFSAEVLRIVNYSDRGF